MVRGRAAFLLLALGGSLTGHALGYAAAGAGHVHPRSTGFVDLHGYLPGAAKLVAPLAVVAFGWFVLSGARRRRPGSPGIHLGGLLLAQVGIYGVQEVLERLVPGVGVARVLVEPAVWLGLLAQLVVGLAVVAAVRLLREATAAVLLWLRGRSLLVGSLAEALLPVSQLIPRVRLQAGSVSLRGPPVSVVV